ncbi:PilC/PilY family type IV pilus protein [Magnetococcales bacterium HHB-1]
MFVSHKHINHLPPLRKRAVFLALVLALLTTSTGTGEVLTLETKPLYLQTRIDPNIFFKLDDSGSMDWTILTTPYWYYWTYWDSNNQRWEDEGLWSSYNGSSRKEYAYWHNNADNLYGNSYPAWQNERFAVTLDWRVRSADLNVLYYNPTINYKPWPGFPDADFNNVRSNPQSGQPGYTVRRNLSGLAYEVWNDDAGYSGNYPDWTSNVPNYTSGANGLVDLWDSHTRYTVNDAFIRIDQYTYDPDNTSICSYGNGTSRCMTPTTSTTTRSGADADNQGRTLAEAKQNIANWYQYHRRRSFVAKNAISSVISSNPGYRYGLSVINNYNSLFVEMPDADVDNYTTQNNNLISSLFAYRWQARGTPLRLGLDRAGKYYQGQLSGKTSPILESCQQNFTILFTDGYWNGENPSLSPSDQDGDGFTRTLADVAQKYYTTDLSSALENNVPISTFDPANYQHMVTFGVSFGIRGNLTDSDGDGWPNDSAVDRSSPADGIPDSNGNWGNPNSCYACSEKVDDLWHASYNGRGLFVSAQTPQAVLSALEEALANISERTSSAASAALNTGSLSSDARLYQARFFSGDWSGTLLSFGLDQDSGRVDKNQIKWSAREKLNDQNYDTGRTIVTLNTTSKKGVPFRWPSNANDPNENELSAVQVSALNDDPETSANDDDNLGEARLNYLRGNRSNEGTGSGQFRIRATLSGKDPGPFLGDIIHSDPVYVGPPSNNYPKGLSGEDGSYDLFKATYANRGAMIYVGANDGMLHGFNANLIDRDNTAGQEKLAYVPAKVFPNLSQLTSPNYTHKYYVDGKITVSDAYGAFPNCAGSCWRTILVGSLRSGGKGFFALDVTDPNNFTEDNAENIALWEFTDSEDSGLGYAFSQASIVRLADGNWAAVFGNGYLSEGDDATLYVVKLDDGSLIKKISTGGQGLATPAVADVDGNAVADYAYAGDLQGNMWKFDLSSSDPADWSVANGGTALFIASTPASAETDCGGSTTEEGDGMHEEIIDERDGNGKNSSSGSWSERDSNQDWGARFRRHRRSSSNRSGSWTFNFDPVPEDGSYDVYAWWVSNSDYFARNVPHDIFVNGTRTNVFRKDQSRYGNRWNKLVSLELDRGDVVKVRVRNNRNVDRSRVVADAAKIVQTARRVEIEDNSNGYQPITVRPEVSAHPEGLDGYIVYFGTGRFFAEGDNQNRCVTTQSFYGIWDNAAAVVDIRNESGDYGTLLKQEVISEQTNVSYGDNTFDVRATSDNNISWSNKKGWYIDFVNPNDGFNHGEKIFNNPVLVNGRVIFTSGIVSTDPCSTEEGGWLYELNWANGGRLDKTFDLDEDDQFDENDKMLIDGNRVGVSGKRSTVGIPTAPALLTNPEKDMAYKYVSGSAGGVPEKTSNYMPTVTTTGGGRQSWRQLFSQ